MAKVASVAEAMRKQAVRTSKAGPTVEVRAIAPGFFGHPIASMRKVGEVFRMPIGTERGKLHELKEGERYYTGQPMRFVTAQGKKWALPTWCEDPNAPTLIKSDEDVEDEYAEAGESVI